MYVKLGKLSVGALATVALVLLAASFGLAQPAPVEQLGEMLYFDEALSDPDGQSCASCHLPKAGFADPDHNVPVSEGVVSGLFGSRNSPMSAYAMYAPPLYLDNVEGLWIGGQFWDGRATGGDLGDPLADQAIGPPLNPVEMANEFKETVLRDILNGPYAQLFIEVCGNPDFTESEQVDAAYNCMGNAIAKFERTALFGQFNSKYDYYLKTCLEFGGEPDDCAVGMGDAAKRASEVFTEKEWDGFKLFMNDVNNNDGVADPGEGAMCVLCHVADWTAAADYAPGYDLSVHVPEWAPAGMVPPLFTDFTYDNLGVPKSDHPLLVNNPVDVGLGQFKVGEDGKFKVMTLRNIGITRPYAHNGLFSKLDDITHFYNTRDALPDCALVAKPKVGDNCWPAPEVPDNVNVEELGNLGLTKEQEKALVAFMETLSDGYMK